MADTTRQQFLQTARQLFARKGFYGTSLANIAAELGLTKQALLHHFGSKEQLYAEILEAISARMLNAVSTAQAAHQNPAQQLEAILVSMYQASAVDPQDTQIVIRELLDVQQRADNIQNWYLRPFLDALVAVIRELPGAEAVTHREALALIYPILGSMNYLVASQVVLSEMYGADTYDYLSSRFPERLRDQVGELIRSLDSVCAN